jgi:hypothetical protein
LPYNCTGPDAKQLWTVLMQAAADPAIVGGGGRAAAGSASASAGGGSSWPCSAGCMLLGQLPQELLLRILHFAASPVSCWI